MSTKTLRDVMPHEFLGYWDVPAYKHLDVEVEKEFDGTVTRWPGKEKFVLNWVLLKNGRAVGWNENPSRGWSFPLIKYKA